MFHFSFCPAFKCSASMIGCGTVTTLLLPTFLNFTVRRFFLRARSRSNAFCASTGLITSSPHRTHFHPLTSMPFQSVFILFMLPPHSQVRLRFSNSIFIPHQFFEFFAECKLTSVDKFIVIIHLNYNNIHYFTPSLHTSLDDVLFSFSHLKSIFQDVRNIVQVDINIAQFIHCSFSRKDRLSIVREIHATTSEICMWYISLRYIKLFKKTHN